MLVISYELLKITPCSCSDGNVGWEDFDLLMNFRQRGSHCGGGCSGCGGGCEHTPMEELVALMKYMVSHNASHVRELAELAQQMDEKGKEMNLSIRLQREDIFDAMHKI